MDGDKKESLSFGFKRKQDIVQLAKSAVSEDADQEVHETDYVLSLEGKEVKSSKRSEKPAKTEYIIPLIKHNKWRTGDGSDNPDTPASLDQQAVQEILQDTARYNQEWVDRGQEDTQSVIPLLLQNKIPEGFESDDRLDVALRPQDPSEADYQQIPIEQFGLAMLRGMGWSKGKGIGKNSKVTAPVEAHIRPKGLGLGADRNNSGPDNAKPNPAHNGVDDKGEELELKKNAYCLVTAGSNKDLYGTIEGIDEDNSRLIIKLALSGKVVNVMQSNVRVVGKPEFEKYSKYLNKQKTDEYKAKEMKKLENLEAGERADASKSKKHKRQINHQSDSDSDVHSGRDKKSKTGEKHRYPDENQQQSKHKKRQDKHCRQKVNSTSDHLDSDEKKYSGRESISWLRNDLRVRIVDRNLGGGRYYKEKAVIVDVPSQGMCVCKTDGGRVLENVSELSLETVVPRVEDAFVAIVGGSHRGQIGRIMKRDKDKCLALVQLLSDRDTVLRVEYDNFCEYVGDVHQYHDY